MNVLILVSSVLGFVLTFPLCYQILKGTVVQSFTTWVLWFLLDSLSTTFLILQGGNFYLTIAYALGCILVSLCILKQREFKWTKFDSLILSLVLFCIFVWVFTNAECAIVASTLATVVAGIPQLVETYKKPEVSPITVNSLYLIASTLSIIGAKNWSIGERFFPVVVTIYGLLLVFAGVRKRIFKLNPS